MNRQRGAVFLMLLLLAVPLRFAAPAASAALQSARDRFPAPLVLDLGADGFLLTSATDGVMFDLDGDGTAERTGWTHPDGDDVFLAIDATRTGAIEDGRKLLGGLFNRQNGFTTLERLDADPSLLGPELSSGPGPLRSDGQIVAADPVYQRLILWRDANRNGVAEGAELKSAESAGLVTLYTGVVGLDKADAHGNTFVFSSRALVRNEHGVPVAAEVRSVRFVR